MESVILKRVSYTDCGTFGVLLKDGMPLCVTLEDPWNNNQANTSCIPTGRYEVTPFNGTKYKGTWVINGVPDRSYILFHTGNSILDTQGCVLVGKSFNGYEIRESRNAFSDLKDILPDRFMISITNGEEEVTKKGFWSKIKEIFL